MEQNYVESNKSYKHGFVLKEQDLRRIVDLMNEQLKKQSTNEINHKFTIKYENGAVASTDNLDEILSQDNEGSESIVRLEIDISQKSNDTISSIKLDFRDPEEVDRDSVPIRHIIKSQSRDWVFVTSSLIEERIAKIKRKSINPTQRGSLGNLLFRLFSPILMIVFMICMFLAIPKTSDKLSEKKVKYINDIEQKWELGEITDPFCLVLELERAKATVDNQINTNDVFLSIFFSKPFIIIICGFVILGVILILFTYYYPMCNFCWGNYIEVFEKKESRRKWIMGLFIGTIVLGVLVNLLSNLIWHNL